MKNTFDLPLGTRFIFDPDKKSLTLTSLAGLTCGHNEKEDDYSCSGLAVIGADSRRLEGAKLQYEVVGSDAPVFRFAAFDPEGTVRLETSWTFEQEFNLISCRSTLTNTSSAPVVIRRALPRWVFSPGDYTVHYQMNRWGAENQLQSQLVRGGDLLLHGRAARSTVGSAPFCILRDNENGSGAAFHVLPRGNWTIQVHSDILNNEFPSPIVEAGLSDTDLFLTLAPGEKLELPEVLVQEVPPGELTGAAADLHRYMIRKRLPADLHQPPVVYNGWLYRFANFTREQLSRQLAAAKEIGCEVFIVDAGWFGTDKSWGKVGDWREKEGAPFFGDMASFADEVRAAGLKFGFWMEPERWANDIPVRAEHPEWFPAHTSRIDLTQPAAAEHFYKVLSENVRKFGAEYIKIDFNASVGYDESGAELHGYCTVLAELLKRLRKEFPQLTIENCGSGALRSDLTTAQLYDHAFVSDNAHPYETLRIRQGTFLRFPPGRVLNWIVMRPAPERRTKISDCDQVLACASATWDEAALFDLKYVMISGLLGIPGFSGELADFEPEMRRKMAAYIDFYKANRKLFSDSHVFLLTPPDSKVTDYENYLVFQMQADESDESLLFVFSNGASRRSVRNFRLRGLDPAASYRVETLFDENAGAETRSGADLMRYGVRTELPENQHVRHTAGLYRIRREGAE
ncbi:MAG: alpha-galactosidase [Lentisphaeria bacterium]|nr:alpha-galactosidase [Lentisphaeria bacterium]